jgi:hypothetical protein
MAQKTHAVAQDAIWGSGGVNDAATPKQAITARSYAFQLRRVCE